MDAVQRPVWDNAGAIPWFCATGDFVFLSVADIPGASCKKRYIYLGTEFIMDRTYVVRKHKSHLGHCQVEGSFFSWSGFMCGNGEMENKQLTWSIRFDSWSLGSNRYRSCWNRIGLLGSVEEGHWPCTPCSRFGWGSRHSPKGESSWKKLKKGPLWGMNNIREFRQQCFPQKDQHTCCGSSR